MTAFRLRMMAAGAGLACIGLAALSGGRFLTEISAVHFHRQNDMAALDTLISRAPAVPGSLRGAQSVLSGCLTAFRGPVAGLLPEAERRDVVTHCRQIATTVLARQPTSGAARLALALVARGEDDLPLFERMLLASQASSAHERWLAELRLNASAPLVDRLSPAALAALRNDIALLADEARSVDYLASLYRTERGLRPLLTRTIETLPDAVQRRFIGAVRRSRQA